MMTGSYDPVIFIGGVQTTYPPFDKDYNLVMNGIISLHDFVGEM